MRPSFTFCVNIASVFQPCSGYPRRAGFRRLRHELLESVRQPPFVSIYP